MRVEGVCSQERSLALSRVLGCLGIMDAVSTEELDEEELLVRRHRKEKKELQGDGEGRGRGAWEERVAVGPAESWVRGFPPRPARPLRLPGTPRPVSG